MIRKPKDTSPSATVVCERRTLPQDLIRSVYFKPSLKSLDVYLKELPARRPSSLPPAGNGHLEATLGNFIGYGHSSTVFSLKDVAVHGLPASSVVPPLVAKIARLDRVTSVMRDAWFYDEMECLQGSTIPRCYGYFEMESINSSAKLVLRRLARRYPSDEPSKMNPILKRDKARGPLHPLMKDRSRRTDVLAVLIMERLGSPLPPCQPVSKETR